MCRLLLLFACSFTLTALAPPPRAVGQGPGGGGFKPRAEASDTAHAAASAEATNRAGGDTPPSLKGMPARGSGSAGPGRATEGGKLPQAAGQQHRVYDLRPYTGYLSDYDRPHQAVVDWVIRETGSDVWFTEPFGFLSADRDQLSVYHTPEMHRVVSGVVDRFVAGEKEPQVLNLRLMTVGNPNWRSRAHMLMQHVSVDSPGVQAWLLTKENAAVVMNMLRSRTDTREIQAVDLITHNGQSESLSSTRGRNYVRNIRPAPAGWPPYEPETGEIREGYRLEISPLLSTDGETIDCAIRAEIDQVDKLVPVELDLPLPNGQLHRGEIDVPQVVSWRLHERFRWPSDMVLLLSCGVVASPERPSAMVPLVNLEALTGTTAGRADALLFVEFRGRASENLSTTAAPPQVATGIGAPGRGRY